MNESSFLYSSKSFLSIILLLCPRFLLLTLLADLLNCLRSSFNVSVHPFLSEKGWEICKVDDVRFLPLSSVKVLQKIANRMSEDADFHELMFKRVNVTSYSKLLSKVSKRLSHLRCIKQGCILKYACCVIKLVKNVEQFQNGIPLRVMIFARFLALVWNSGRCGLNSSSEENYFNVVFKKVKKDQLINNFIVYDKSVLLFCPCASLSIRSFGTFCAWLQWWITIVY